MDARLRRILTLCALAGALAVSLTATAPSTALPGCGPWHSRAVGTDGNGSWTPEVGFRRYTLSIQSMLQDCGPNVTRARHALYLDTRPFPYGHKFMVSVSTRRSDGKWQAVKSKRGGFIFLVSGQQKIQEIIFRQTRNTSGPWRLTDVHVRHCACSLDSGSVPAASTLKARYKRFNGPQAGPRD